MKNPELKPAFRRFSNNTDINPDKKWLTVLMPVDATPEEIAKKVEFHKWIGDTVEMIED